MHLRNAFKDGIKILLEHMEFFRMRLHKKWGYVAKAAPPMRNRTTL